MMNEICAPHSSIHIYVLIVVFLWEHILSKTKFGSTIGVMFAPFKKKE